MPWASMFIIVSDYQVAVCIYSRVIINFHDHTGGLKKKKRKIRIRVKFTPTLPLLFLYICHPHVYMTAYQHHPLVFLLEPILIYNGLKSRLRLSKNDIKI